MDIMAYIIFFLLIFLLGYASGRKLGYKQGLEDGKKYAPLDMKKVLLRKGICPICYQGMEDGENRIK